MRSAASAAAASATQTPASRTAPIANFRTFRRITTKSPHVSSRLTREFPERATVLFAKNEENAKERYEHLLKLIDLYDK